jgi:dienelactone hydrolase
MPSDAMPSDAMLRNAMNATPHPVSRCVGKRRARGPSPISRGEFVSALALLFLTVGCAATSGPVHIAGTEDVSIPPIAAPMARMPAEAIPGVLLLPSGRGRSPAVIVLHGCAGRGNSQLIWAARLNEWGYAALIPDSMTPRGIERVCEPEAQGLITPRDRVGDVGSAAIWLRTRSEIDPSRIAVLGLSHGGTTAVLATQRLYDSFRLRAAIDYYGPCVEPELHGTVPLLVLVGGSDDWGHPASRCEAYGNAVGTAEPFEIHVYPGAYHAFDNPDMVRTVSNQHVLEYNQAAAEDSFVRVHDFLRRWFKH